jgi:hypothetical protein
LYSLRDIYKLFLRNKKTIKVILSSIIRIGLIIYIEDPKEAFGVDYTHIKDTEAEETIIADIITTSHFIRSNTTSIISLDISQVSIQQKRDNKHTLNINNIPNM